MAATAGTATVCTAIARSIRSTVTLGSSGLGRGAERQAGAPRSFSGKWYVAWSAWRCSDTAEWLASQSPHSARATVAPPSSEPSTAASNIRLRRRSITNGTPVDATKTTKFHYTGRSPWINPKRRSVTQQLPRKTADAPRLQTMLSPVTRWARPRPKPHPTTGRSRATATGDTPSLRAVRGERQNRAA